MNFYHRPFTLPPEIIRNLESKLNEPQFMGVPIGSTLGDIYNLQLHQGHGEWDFMSVLLDRLRVSYNMYRGVKKHTQVDFKTSILPSRPILIGMRSDVPRLRDMMEPIIAQLGVEFCNIFVSAGSTAASPILEAATTYSMDGLARFYDRATWLHHFFAWMPQWFRRLHSTLKQHCIPGFVMPRLLDLALINSQRIVAYHNLLRSLSPEVLVVDFDRHSKMAGLVLAARKQNLPTVTLVHGVLNAPYSGYTPLLADIACCWGEQSKQQMIDEGVDPVHLAITGYHRMSLDSCVDRQVARAKFNVAADQAMVLYASNTIGDFHRKQLARSFSEALAGNPQVVAVIRLHPAEDAAFYAQEIDDFPTIKYSTADFVTVDEAIAAADIVVIRTSGFGNDALIKGKPVVIFDIINTPLGNAEALISHAGCPHVQSIEELRTTITQIINDASYRTDLQKKAEPFIQYQFQALGDKALDNVVNEIQAIWHRD